MAGHDRKSTILLVEDDLGMREIICNKLQKAGFDVITAVDGKEALSAISAFHPHLVVMDLMMPEKNGFEVLADLRKSSDKKIANLPVIILSNLWDNDTKLKARELRVNDFLVKAYLTPEQIVNKVKVAMSS